MSRLDARRDRRRSKAAAATLGESLLRVRDQRAYESQGFATFEEFCRARVPELCPQWELNPDQVDVLVAEAIALAVQRRRRRGRA